MKMLLKSFTLACFTSILVSLSVLAGEHSGKCFNRSADEYNKCTISISEEALQLTFKDSPEANVSIPMDSIREIHAGQDSRIGAATILVSPFFRKKVLEFTVTYLDEAGGKSIATFRTKKKRATSLQMDLVNFSGVGINQI